MNLLIIPARGGSKRIPKKNIRDFKGKPIIEITINKSRQLKLFDKLIVSTDDDEIANISKNAGAEIPFIRPKEISGDYIPTREVILHAIEWYKTRNIEFNLICCLYPTSIFFDKNDISRAIQLLKKINENKYIFSATNYSHPIERSFYIDKKGLAIMNFPNKFNERSQDLKSAYHDAAQFYIAKSKTWTEKKNIFEQGIPFLLPKWKSIDIDTYEDWEMAEIIFENKIYKNI